MRSSPSECAPPLDISKIEHSKVKHLNDDTSGQYRDYHQVRSKSRFVKRGFVGIVHEWSGDVAYGKTDEQDTSGRGLLGMAGGVGKGPGKDDRRDALEDLEDEVDGQKLGLVFWAPWKSV